MKTNIKLEKTYKLFFIRLKNNFRLICVRINIYFRLILYWKILFVTTTPIKVQESS